MAKKAETISLIDTFSEFKETKNIDRTTMVSVLEESFRSVIAKMFGTDENYDVIVNPDKGDFEIWRNREMVADADLVNPNMQISLSEAQKIDESYEVGEEVTDEVFFEKFGRRAILNLRQTLASKILELEKDSLYNKYIDKVGTIISAEVYQIWKKEILLLDDEGNELLLPKSEQIPSDFYRKGEAVRAVDSDHAGHGDLPHGRRVLYRPDGRRRQGGGGDAGLPHVFRSVRPGRAAGQRRMHGHFPGAGQGGLRENQKHQRLCRVGRRPDRHPFRGDCAAADESDLQFAGRQRGHPGLHG